MTELSIQYDFNFYNLGQGTEHNVLSRLFAKDFPLPEKIVEKIKLAKLGNGKRYLLDDTKKDPTRFVIGLCRSFEKKGFYIELGKNYNFCLEPNLLTQL